jgi:hypothetical protein
MIRVLGAEKVDCLEHVWGPAELEELAEVVVNRSQYPAVSQRRTFDSGLVPLGG